MSYNHIKPHTFEALREVLQQHYGRCVDLAAALMEEQAAMSFSEIHNATKALVQAKQEMRLLEYYLEQTFLEEFSRDKANL